MAAERLEAGRVVGHYRLDRVLGEGTYGRVHLARHEVLGRWVAVKVLHRRHDARRQEIRAFLNEALILADLVHPGIVPVFDAGWEEDGIYYIVSKYVEGADLGQVIRQGRPGHRQSAGFVEAVAGALTHAHSRGLVHRDIKPANILIDAAGRAYVTDFGVALRDRDFGRGARLTGTPAYMSPEQARGEAHRVDGRSDVFSLGIVFYELLTGQRPFRGKSMEVLSEQIVRADAPRPREVDPGIPEELERICLKALAKRAGARYPSAEEMAADLRKYLAEVPEPGVPLGLVIPARPLGDARRMPSVTTDQPSLAMTRPGPEP